MTYSPFGTDDSDLEDWIRQQAESGALDDLASPSPMQPLAAYQAPQHAEMAPLKLDTGPDWSDALGAGTTALAALADLGLNHGHGTGQILAAGGQFGQARAEQRLKGTQDALSYEEKRAQLDKSNRYNDYLYASMAQRGQLGQERLGQAGERIAVSKQNADTKTDANARANRQAESDQFIDYAKTKGYDLEGLRGSTMTQVRSAMGPLVKQWELEHADEKAAATAEGRIGAELGNSEALGDAAASKAGKVAAAQLPYKTEGAEQGAAARVLGTQRGETEAGSNTVVPGLVAVDPQAAAQSLGNPVTERKLRDDGGAFATARSALKKMGDLRRAYGTELPGNAKTQFDMAQTTVNAALSALGATKSLSDSERHYYMDMIPGLALGWSDAVRPGGIDIKQQQLDGALTEFTEMANGKLRAYGVGLDTGGNRPQPSAASDPLPPDRITGPVTDSFNVPGNLGVTGRPGVRNTPDFPGGMRRAGPGAVPGPTQLPRAQPNPDGTFTLPGGKRSYTAQEVQQFIQMGALAPL
jgi:hypothetical protein